MKFPFNQTTRLFLLGTFLCFLKGYTQLQFCEGNSGDAIFEETFGTGLQDGPQLPAGTTTYNYVNGGPNQPLDGNYTISSRTNYFDWFNTTDHTPGDVNGKAFIVNADFTPGEFFRREINGLCENTSYEFSSWLLNLLPAANACPDGGIPINVRFQIWDDTDTVLLASGDTGNIPSTVAPNWRQFGLVFSTSQGQTSVILKMINNGAGGCGNDLAIDDIVFRSCGDFIAVLDDENETIAALCQDDDPFSTTLNAQPDFTVFNTHFYQWQESTDQENWTDIPGETSSFFNTPQISETTYYRVKVAEDEINVSNSFCNVISDVYEILFVPVPEPPIAPNNQNFCENEPIMVIAQVPDNTSVNWYNQATGGTLLTMGSTVFSPTSSGTYYAEASSTIANCVSTTRTAVEVTIFETPELSDETIDLCEGGITTLSANFPNANYLWSNGETTENITVETAGIYTVRVTNEQACSNLKTITVNLVNTPIIGSIISNAENIEVTTLNDGNFQYSLDGFSFSNNPIFELIPGGEYTVYVRNGNICPAIAIDFIHLVIPKFFSPNGDNNNEFFKPQGLSDVAQYQISIFNRYGALLASSTNTEIGWDGSFNGQPLPASDYWYIITINNTTLKGHFTLKR